MLGTLGPLGMLGTLNIRNNPVVVQIADLV